MFHLLSCAVALSATFTVGTAGKVFPVGVASYSRDAGVILTMTDTGARVVVDIKAKGYAPPFIFRWDCPQDARQVEYSKTVTAKSGDQLSGDWRANVGPGYYSVWVYDATGRFPIAYACLVIPTP